VTPQSAARLLANVDTSGGPDACWPYRGYIDPAGYGAFYVYADGRPQGAHRHAFELLVGEVPAGLVLDHLCHTFDSTCPPGPSCLHRRCCNPTHLEVVTNEENVARAGHRLQTCRRGHPYTESNTLTRPDRPGRRDCRTCRRLRDRKDELLLIGAVPFADDVAGTAEDDEAAAQ
jgi:hypothetical protein